MSEEMNEENVESVEITADVCRRIAQSKITDVDVENMWNTIIKAAEDGEYSCQIIGVKYAAPIFLETLHSRGFSCAYSKAAKSLMVYWDYDYSLYREENENA